MASEQRRASRLELLGALLLAMIEQILSENVSPEYENIQNFLHGPVRDSFLRYLDTKVSASGEYDIFYKEHGLLIVKLPKATGGD
jgi:hypothetical protein